jgi:AraC-like DNA-binding protein
MLFLLQIFHFSHMLLNIISLFVGFLSLFIILLICINPIKRNERNIYFIVILFISGILRFSNGLNFLNLTQVNYTLIIIKPVLAFYIVPVYFLFFQRIMVKDFMFRKELLHFIFPTLLLLINYWFVNFKTFALVYAFYSITYLIMLLVKVKMFFFTKDKSILKKMNKNVIKTWLVLMLFITVSSGLYSNIILFSDIHNRIIITNYLKYSSLLWFIPLYYLFLNPNIIFGEEYLLKKLKKIRPQEHLIWNAKPLKNIVDIDKKLYNSVFNRINTIIIGIQNLEKSVLIISKKTLNAKIIAEELNIPKRHIDLIFKYYCHYSVNDYTNFIKINYALTLINDGYLNEYTVEALGEKCLFKSRFTFSQNFKKFVGTSVSEYTYSVIGKVVNE